MTETKQTKETQSESCCSTETVQSVRIAIDILKCNGCGLCGEVCPFGLPQKNSLGVFEITQPESCTECSACQKNIEVLEEIEKEIVRLKQSSCKSNRVVGVYGTLEGEQKAERMLVIIVVAMFLVMITVAAKE